MHLHIHRRIRRHVPRRTLQHKVMLATIAARKMEIKIKNGLLADKMRVQTNGHGLLCSSIMVDSFAAARSSITITFWRRHIALRSKNYIRWAFLNRILYFLVFDEFQYECMGRSKVDGAARGPQYSPDQRSAAYWEKSETRGPPSVVRYAHFVQWYCHSDNGLTGYVLEDGSTDLFATDRHQPTIQRTGRHCYWMGKFTRK